MAPAPPLDRTPRAADRAACRCSRRACRPTGSPLVTPVEPALVRPLVDGLRPRCSCARRRRPGSTTRRSASTTPSRARRRGLRTDRAPPSPRAVLARGPVALVANARRLLNTRAPWRARRSPHPRSTRRHSADGAVRSVSRPTSRSPRTQLDELWTAHDLERLARTYWRFLTRVTLGLIRVDYTRGRARPSCSSAPAAAAADASRRPEYEMDARARHRALADRDAACSCPAAAATATATWRSTSSAARRAAGHGACTSRSRSRTSTRRSPRGSAAALYRTRNRASTCSSRTASCARWRGWTSAESRVGRFRRGRRARSTTCPTRRAAGAAARRAVRRQP